MVRQPRLQVADQGTHGFFGDVGHVQADLEDFRPTLAAGVLEAVVDILKGLINLFVDVGRDGRGLAVPAAYVGVERQTSVRTGEGATNLGRR
jgi:hypothetical protein